MEHEALPDPDGLLGAGDDQMTLHAEVQGHRVRVLVRGEVDLATAPALREFVLSAVTPEITEQVIDLSEVTFLDSSGIGALVVAFRGATAAGVAFSLLCPELNRPVSKVLEILQISSMMTVVTTDSREQ